MNGSMRIACKDGNKVIGFFEINSLPGCPQVAVSNHAFILPQYRNQGYGKRFHAERLKHIKTMGFSYVICTVVSTNVFQKKILKRFGWKPFDRFMNPTTGNNLEIWGKGLQYEPEIYAP